ncbi:MAG: porin [Thioalkalispiraceae bacterium]|jgi:predicted porin
MNKKIIALAVAGALAAPLAAQAEVKVYGKVHVNAGTYEETVGGATVEDNFQINSYASRFGVKGSHALDGDLKATYKLEWEVNPDNEGVKDLTINNRNQYVGLKGGFGEVRVGTHDTPLKMVQGKFDQFGDTLADLKNAGSQDGEHRLENVIAYLGKAGNLSFAAAVIPGEGDGTTAGDSVADTTSVSLAYKEGPLYIGVAADSYDDTGAASGTSNSLTRLVGTYKFGDSQVGLLWQSGVEKVTASTAEEDWFGVSFNTKLSANYKFKAQYITVEDDAATATENTLTGIGIERKFGKKTKGYLLVTDFESDAAGTANDEEISSVSLGYVIKF